MWQLILLAVFIVWMILGWRASKRDEQRYGPDPSEFGGHSASGMKSGSDPGMGGAMGGGGCGCSCGCH